MSSDSSNLSHLARNKLHLSVSGKDSWSLHRWVLLKNSILNSPSQNTITFTNSQPELSSYSHDDGDDDDDTEEVHEVLSSIEADAFMFPDGSSVSVPSGAKSSEAQWLDSLLETLGDDDDEDDFNVDSDHPISPLPVDDDEFPLYTPVVSPLSSSDDLPNQSAYYSSSISVSYPVPYPPYQPPLIHAYPFDSVYSSSPALPYEDPLPYHDMNDIEDLPVPDAIEDTSDDESDAPTTPSLGRSSSSLSLVDAASVPLPAERSRLRHANPRVYVDSNDSYFYSFEIDPLPFPDEQFHTSYNHYQQC
ncbi:hypothetical protein CPB84DRAFT_1763481 [Gymnopilus junonius]|uniref:Uncharacterized protein n=1 Tax=Gymnopilus junonius TaxID=109634 RepID=A0A9P5TSH5_GYMJU|nr:hypothetical protein CPB84DRAFT_1763481 [Gymnopilus junonius]